MFVCINTTILRNGIEIMWTLSKTEDKNKIYQLLISLLHKHFEEELAFIKLFTINNLPLIYNSDEITNDCM